ncbi:VCBS domain-containing protein [Psychrobacter sp. JCM 18900]|uniref:VCBS domain-containing protein n=1 Tax=Psychrobacter sp. JCM 18900 TaxID=1298608 RepID=UPI0004318804|nr:VCBS domain-containing protein [Psychrobacter sp. JCM 18900]GAF54367.1 hypothetical protein JCM18900_12998 [Psychrobacter sp. JCM 18900]
MTIRYAVQVNDDKGVTTAVNGNELSKSEIRYVEVTITGTNDGGIALADNSITINENGTTTSGGVLATIFDENDTDDPDFGEQLTVESFQIGNGSAITVDPDNLNNLSQNVNVGTNKVGEITFNSDGTYEYVATSDYSGTLPVITANVSNGVTGATREETSQKLTITVNPVSDAPQLTNVSVTTEEDTEVTLGLKAPVITDATDLNSSSPDDTPERIGLVTLTGVPNGTVLDYGVGTITATGAPITIQLDGNGVINNSGPATASMTVDQFEAIKLTPPKDDASNISITMSVTSFEVDSSGNRVNVDGTGAVVTTGGSPITGKTSTSTISIDVTAVTDTVLNNAAGDDASSFGVDSSYVIEPNDGISSIIGNDVIAEVEENKSVDIPITTTFGDLAGSAANGSRETYGFVITGLKPGTVVEFIDASGNVIATSGTVDANGTTTIGANANKDGSGNIILDSNTGLATVTGTNEPVFNTSTGQPIIRIKPDQYNSLDMNDIEVSLYTQDHDSDSDLDPNLAGIQKDASVELIDTINVNLTVTPVAGQVGLDNQGVQTKEDTPVTLDTFGFTVLDKPDGASTEVIDSIVFDIPVGWSYVDGVDSANNVTNAAVVTTITIDMTSSPDLSTFSIKPPAQSSTDTEFSFTVTTTDTDDDGGNTVTSTSESPLTQTVVVTPVAEVVGGRSDNDTIDDLTINPDRVYTATAQEDAAFNLGSGIDANTSTTFNLIDGWSNQDDMVDFGQESHTAAANDSEQTYAHLTFGSRDNGEFTAIAGAVFTYSVDGGATTEPALTDNGTGVDIPAAYLNTVTVTPPQDYSDYTVTSESATAQTAVKVEAKTIDYDEDGGASVTATSGGSYLTFTVTGVADPATLAVDPAEGIEDQAIIGGNTRATAADMGDVTTGTIGSDITPINGIALNIRPSSRDSLSETYDVTISEIPLDGQLYQNNKGVITLLDTSSGSVIIPNYTNDVTNLYFVPAENYSGTVTLKVSAVSQEEGTTGTQSTTLNLPIKVIGKADLILNDDLAVDLENVNYTKVIAEDQPNSEGLSTNSIAVSDFFDDAMSIAPYDSGSPQPEAISYSITGLPEGFNIIGAGVVFLGGSGADRVWSVPLAAIQNGGAMLTTPEHFAGDISFDIQDTTTERVSGNSVTHSPKTVSVLIVPDAADGTVNNPQVVAFEDEWTTIDFNAAFKTTDASAGDEVLDTITLNPDDIANVVLLVNGEAPEVGNYTFNASDKIEVKYNSANEHSDAPFNIRFDYTYTDTATLTDGTKLITTSSSQTDNEVNVTFQAVTDDPTIALAETDVSIDNSGFNDTATVTVSLTSADQDGSEIFTRLEVSGVPDGIIVQGGIVSNGVWYVDVPNPAITTGIAPSYDLVLERDNGADFSINNINTITVTGVTQDIAGKGIDGREEVDSKDFILELTRTNPGNNPPPADLVNNLVIKPIEPNEDSSFNLGDVIDATLVGTSASSVTAYNIALSGVPEGTNLSVDPEASGQVSAIRIGDQWIISVNDASTLTPQKALNAISVSLPEDFSTNETGQELSFNATFTARDNKGREDVSPTENIAITVKPVTDTFDNHNGISPVVAAEDARVDIDINLTNSADGDYVSLINGKLYIEIDESNLKRGNGDAGILEYNGTRLNSTEVTASELAGTGIAPGEYYVVDVADSNGAIDGVNPPSSVKVQYTPAADANGSAIIFVNAAHKEVSDVAIDGDIETYKHQYTVDVTAQPDKLNVFKPDTEDTTVTAVGNEDTLIPIPYEISSRDTQGDNDGSVNGKFDKATGISIDNVPDGYLVYYIDSNDIQQLANNNGNKNSNGNLWTINATDLSSEADSIFIQPPENISAEVTGVEMRVISDSGLVSEPLNITLQVKPVADGLTFNPTDTIGNQGKWTALNLNAVLEDTDSSETVNIVITDNGVNLTDDVLRFRVNSNKELLTAIWDEATNSYTIIGITLKQINDLQINSSVPLEADLEFALSTTDTVTYTEGTVTDTSDVYIDIDGNVPSVSVDIAFSKTFVGTEENDIVDASGQSVSVNYKGGAGDDIFIGGSGNDFLDGGTGANTLRGGAGNDTLVFAADNLLMDGGAGIDTLLINMANTTIDFGTFDLSKFESIEVIDMTGNGAQSLTNLSTIDVLDIISDTAMINKDLIIKGDGGINGDSVTLTDEWISSGTRSQGGTSYNVYSFSDTNGTHDLLIQTDVNTTIL